MPSWEKTHGIPEVKTDWAVAALGEKPFPRLGDFDWNNWSSRSGYEKLLGTFESTETSDIEKSAAEELRTRHHPRTESFDVEK